MPAYDFIKDPNSILDYTLDYADVDEGPWLDRDNNEEISTSTWIVPDGITKVTDSKTATTTTIWLSGGTDRVFYEVVNRIVTDSVPARTVDRTLTIWVKER